MMDLRSSSRVLRPRQFQEIMCDSENQVQGVHLRESFIDLDPGKWVFPNNEQFVKEMLDNIVDDRKSLEVEALKKIEREDKCLADQRAFELEKLKLQAQNPPASVGNSS
ncbi:hypothetical protein TNCV_410521 [Trichonephila clavipes]|nr:hypothetical protein TNCV_410521 [Trichonephila clavipes]